MTPAQIFIVLQLVTQYGPDIVSAVKSILNKKDATIDDVEAIFAGLKPYESFGIPGVVPTKVP